MNANIKSQRQKFLINGIYFTAREVDVFACIVSGRSSRKSIANILNISPATVATYLRTIMQKLECSSVETVRIFLEASTLEEEFRIHFRNMSNKENSSKTLLEQRALEYAQLPTSKLYSGILRHMKHTILTARNIYFGRMLITIIILLCFKLLYRTTELNIRSELIVPDEKILLKRINLTKTIAKALYRNNSSQNKLSIITLVGIGGAGKTTLARLVAKVHKGLVWEINAQTKTTLMRSLRELAYYCARTNEDKDRINFIQNLGDELEQRRQIMLFIKDKIREQPDWLLIYDNVENLEIISEGLPFDYNVWGKGHVILTTRNENINIGVQIKIEKLHSSEMLELFLNSSQKNTKIHPEEKNNLYEFLKRLPPYPLDVVIAGKYLHESKISKEDYLLSVRDKNNQIQQREILSEAQAYTQTRHDIIDVALTRLIKENPEYLKLLLLISYVDSQNIPVHFCDQLTNKQVTQKFIRQMKSASLLTINKDAKHEIFLISFHRSIQEGIATWLENSSIIDRSFSEKTLEKIIITLEDYIHSNLRQEQYEKLHKILPHLEQLITKNISSQESYKILKAAYGCLLCCLERFTIDTLQYLEAGLEIKDSSNDYRTGLIQFYYGYILGSWGQYAKSIYYTEKSIETIKRKYFNSIEYFIFINNLACMYRAIGKYQEARHLVEEAQRLQQLYPQNYRAVAESFARYPLILRDEGKYKEALTGLLKSVNVLYNNQRFLVKLSQPYIWLNIVYIELGYYQVALKGLRDYSEFGGCYIDALGYSGVCHYYLGNFSEAQRLLEKAYKIYKETNYCCNYNAFKGCLPILGKIYIHFRSYKKARGLLEECLSYSEKLYGKEKFQSAKTICYLGELDLAEGNIEKAENNMQHAYSLLKAQNHTDMYVPLESLAMLYLEKSRLAKVRNKIVAPKEFNAIAQNYLYEASKLIKDRFPLDSAHIKRIEKKIKDLDELLGRK